MHSCFFFLSLYSPSFISKEAGITRVVQESSPSKSHLKVDLYLSSLPYHCCNALHNPFCRNTTKSNNLVIIQVDPLISRRKVPRPPLCFVESETFNKTLITVVKFLMRERCCENHLSTLHFYRPNIALTFKLMKLNSNTYGHTLNMASVIKQLCGFCDIFNITS